MESSPNIMIENRLAVVVYILSTLAAQLGKDHPVLLQTIADLLDVLSSGAEKHADSPHRGALSDIRHAHDHLCKAEQLYTCPAAREGHLSHAAVDSLLAFCSLSGLIPDTKGPTMGEV